MRILLVDDNPMFCYATALELEGAGHTVLTADNGSDALERFAEQMPEALISDIQMPVMDGAELIRRALGIAPDLPVVIVTASFDKAEEILREHPQAAILHVPKPLMGGPLKRALEKVVAQSRQNQQSRQRQQAQPG